MQVTIDTLNSERCSVKIFDSVSEICEVVGKSGRAVFEMMLAEHRSVLGRSFSSVDEILDAVNGKWDEGLEILESMISALSDIGLPEPVSRIRRTRYNEDGGDEICLDRLRGGQADFWRDSYRQPVYGNPVVTINAAIGCLASVKADDVIWRGAAAVAMTVLLERAGYSVELWATSHSTRVMRGDAGSCFTAIKLKAAGGPLNESSLVNAVSAWFFRTVVFASRYTNGKSCNNVGRTISQTFSEGFKKCISDDPSALTIDDCFSFDDAADIARQHLQTICERAEGMVA